MAASALRPLALDFMELLAGSDFEIEEFQLSDNPQYFSAIHGRSLAELELGRRSGALVIAIRDQGRLIANPDARSGLATSRQPWSLQQPAQRAGHCWPGNRCAVAAGIGFG